MQQSFEHLVIGVTSADDPSPDNYVAAISRNGAVPRVLKSIIEQIAEDLAGIDGLLITGGTDIDPNHYHAQPHEKTDTPDTTRDAYELAAVKYASEKGIPILMICRGMQIANVAFGGTLHQHIPDIVDGTVIHSDMNRKFEPFPEHIVILEPDSQLAKITGKTQFPTNASHHQAVATVGKSLRIVARTDDGIIEALEYPAAKNFWIATQWHPERLLESDTGESQAIFQAFLTACLQKTTAP